MTKAATENYAQQLDQTIDTFSRQFEGILFGIVRQAVSNVVQEVAVAQRWSTSPVWREHQAMSEVKGPLPGGRWSALPEGHRGPGRPKGSKNKPKAAVAMNSSAGAGKGCSAAGCTRLPVVAKGMCGMHYRKAWRRAKDVGIPDGGKGIAAS